MLNESYKYGSDPFDSEHDPTNHSPCRYTYPGLFTLSQTLSIDTWPHHVIGAEHWAWTWFGSIQLVISVGSRTQFFSDDVGGKQGLILQEAKQFSLWGLRESNN